jgi:hypothetical protein
MLGLSRRSDGMARRPDGWNNRKMDVRMGWDGTIIRTADREPTFLTAESSKTLLNSEIPCKTPYLHTSDFVQTE